MEKIIVCHLSINNVSLSSILKVHTENRKNNIFARLNFRVHNVTANEIKLSRNDP